MPTKRLWTLTAAVLLGLSSPALSDDLFDIGWDLKSDKDNIQVYTGNVAGSKFKAVKATTEVEASLGEIVALVQDPEACPEWAALCKQSEHLSVISETELTVYTLNDLPWPVSDRDANAKIQWSQNPQTLAVEMLATVIDEGKPPRKGALRLQYGITGWTFTPMANGKVAIESRAHLDPGGATPAWLTNRLLVDAPHQTLSNMRKLLSSKRYAGSEFEFLREPAAALATQ